MHKIAHIPLPDYCERIGNGFFGEPLNLFTNFLFILSAYLAWCILAKSSVLNKRYLRVLVALIALVGIGSFIFHATPNEFTILLDAVPIYIFIILSLLFLLKKLTESWLYSVGLGALIASILVGASALLPSNFLNGSFRHVLILLTVFVILLWMLKKYGKVALGLIPVLVLYVLAITARSVDQLVCMVIPFGTHFIWHILNAAVCYFVIAFLIKLEPIGD
jgi:ceramidase